MALPILSASTAAAALAYLDAKLSLSYDCFTTAALVQALRSATKAESADRVNAFHLLEDRAQAKATSNSTFLAFEDREWPCSSAYAIVLQYGHWLRHAHGVAPGDTVAMDMTNKPEFLWTWLGLWSIGAKPAFINHNLRKDALVHCVRVSAARLLIVDEDVQEALTDEVRSQLESPDGPNVNIQVLDRPCQGNIGESDAVRQPDADRCGDRLTDMACLIFTSGTTGMPKAAVVPWWKIQAAMAHTSALLRLTPADRVFSSMPLYHSTATVLCLGPCLYSGSTFVLARKFSASSFWPQVRDSEATVIQYVGETLRYLMAVRPSPLDRAHKVRIAYGSGLRPDVWTPFKERFGIDTVFEQYGSTEGVGGFQNISRNSFAVGAIGRAGFLSNLLFGPSWALVQVDYEKQEPWRDPDNGFCKRVKSGKPGEMIQKLPEQVDSRFAGYWGNESASQSKVLRNVFRTGDAWYRTGDLMWVDDEGRLYFSDRLGDTFRWKSENVSTAEVAEACGRHDDIAESTVYGVAIPQHDGRAGCAAIVLKDGCAPSDQWLRAFAEHMRGSLPPYARPIFLRITPQLEKTGTNKHIKTALQREGVDPSNATRPGDRLFWLRDSTYEAFGEEEWTTLSAGRARL